MPVWLWGWSAYGFVCRWELSQPVCWAQKMWLCSKAESRVAVVKSTEPKLMSPLETRDLMAWPRCLCLTQYLCCVGGAKPASKSASASPYEPALLFPQGNELPKHAGIPDNSAHIPQLRTRKTTGKSGSSAGHIPEPSARVLCQRSPLLVTAHVPMHTPPDPDGMAHTQLSQDTALGHGPEPSCWLLCMAATHGWAGQLLKLLQQDPFALIWQEQLQNCVQQRDK